MKVYMLRYKLSDTPKISFYHELNKALNIQDSLNINKYFNDLSVIDITKEYYCFKNEGVRRLTDGKTPYHTKFYIKLINTWT